MHKGIVFGLVSAALFGVSTPLAKLLVGSVPPLWLASVLYLGAGIGLAGVLGVRAMRAGEQPRVALPSGRDWYWIGAAIGLGGVAGPVALMYGLTQSGAAPASLLLNFEGVFTALLAWFLFKENFDARIALGMLAIVAGGAVIAWAPSGASPTVAGPLLVVLACFCWALDNNLTRRVSGSDPVAIAALKGLVAGGVNGVLALTLGLAFPASAWVAAAAVVGFLGYGVSLALFILALRELGAARAGAYFSVAPFFGAIFAVALGLDMATWSLALAGMLMAIGVWLHVSERHSHLHRHEALVHAHSHVHDEHHRHEHDFAWDGIEPHTHPHTHEPLVHRHPHFPDLHHRHLHL